MKNLAFLLLGLMVMFSCTSQKETSTVKVPYTEAKNYFVKNTYKSSEISVKKIVSQKEFEEIFGATATMGPNGMPTNIDFSKSYVVAIIGIETNKSTDFLVKNLAKEKDNVILFYSVKEVATENSYSILPVKILIVSKQYDGNIISNKL